MKNNIGELEKYFARRQLDVVAIQEAGSKAMEIQGYKYFWHNKGDVAILVAKPLAPFVAEVDSDTEKQIWVKVTGTAGRRSVFICSAHMPQEKESKDCREKAFESLETSARKFQLQGDVLLMGDLNAKLGTPATATEQHLIGKHFERGSRSGNGSLLADLLRRLSLVNLGGQRPPPWKATRGTDFWYTRYDKARHVKHAIDYILVSSNTAAFKPTFKVDYTHLESDHHLLLATIPCPRNVERKKKDRVVKRAFNLHKMIQKSSKMSEVEAVQERRKEYEEALTEAFRDFTPTGGPQTCGCKKSCACTITKDFIRRTEEALTSSVGDRVISRRFSRPWFDEEVREAVKKTRDYYKEFLQSPTETRWTTFKQFRALKARLIRKKKTQCWEKFLGDFNEAYRGNHKQLWNMVGRLVPNGKKATMAPIKDKNGTLATSEEGIMEAWGDHQENLGTPCRHPLQDDQHGEWVTDELRKHLAETSRGDPGTLGHPFTVDEVEEAVESLHYHKAGATDGTKNPMFKCGGPTMSNILLKFFNHLLEEEVHPDDWARSVVVNLYKEGDRTDPGNYRGISLISCLGKLYLSLWARRIADFLDAKLDDGQGGFRRERSTIDQALTLKEILRKRKNNDKKTFLLFVDFRKAFDTVWHDGLWKRLWDCGIQGKAWRVVKNLYSSIQSRVRVDNQESKSVQMRQGVRQGCPLSPVLFNCFINELAKKLRDTNMGLQVEDKLINALLYADDVVLMAETPEHLQKLIDVVDDFCRKWRMDINLKKSEIMIANEEPSKAPE